MLEHDFTTSSEDSTIRLLALGIREFVHSERPIRAATQQLSSPARRSQNQGSLSAPLLKDRTEQNNLAKDRPADVAALSARWDAWAVQANVLPYPDKGGKAGKYSGVHTCSTCAQCRRACSNSASASSTSTTQWHTRLVPGERIAHLHRERRAVLRCQRQHQRSLAIGTRADVAYQMAQ